MKVHRLVIKYAGASKYVQDFGDGNPASMAYCLANNGQLIEIWADLDRAYRVQGKIVPQDTEEASNFGPRFFYMPKEWAVEVPWCVKCGKEMVKRESGAI